MMCSSTTRSPMTPLSVNASNRDKIVARVARQGHTQAQGCKGPRPVGILAQIAVQGPCPRDILTNAGMADITSLKVRQCLDRSFYGHPTLVTRTGYTGELGYELYLPAEAAAGGLGSPPLRLDTPLGQTCRAWGA